MSRQAPSYPIPSTSLVSVEYPGPVSSHPHSLSSAINTLGGESRLNKALDLSNPDGILQLNFRPHVPSSHSMAGENVLPKDAGSSIVLKVTRRRRRQSRSKTKIVGTNVVDEHGHYTVEVAGVVKRIVRFRNMADLQYHREDEYEDPTVRLAVGLRNMDIDVLQQFRFPEPSEDFEQGDLRLLPPPVFSRLALPALYAYRSNPQSTPITITRPDGSEVTRLVNKAKYKGELLQSVPFSTPPEELPKGPAASLVEGIDKRPGLESTTIEKVLKLFEERPVWTRVALLNQLTKLERSRIQNYKITLPYVSWVFSDGPFRENLIRFGYDPRLDREARFYQRITMRNMSNSKVYLKKIAGASTHGENDVREKDSDEVSHIFDGENVHRNIGNYQLCDIKEPYLKKMCEDEEFVLDYCDPRDGWFDPEYFEAIRQVLRRKFFALLNSSSTTDPEGAASGTSQKLPDDAFDDILAHLDNYRRSGRQSTMFPRAETIRPSDQGEASMVDPALREQSEMTPAISVDEQQLEGESNLGTGMNKRPSVSKLRAKSRKRLKPKAITIMGDTAERLRARTSATAEPDLQSPSMYHGEHTSVSPSTAVLRAEDTIMEEDEQEDEQQE